MVIELKVLRNKKEPTMFANIVGVPGRAQIYVTIIPVMFPISTTEESILESYNCSNLQEEMDNFELVNCRIEIERSKYVKPEKPIPEQV